MLSLRYQGKLMDLDSLDAQPTPFEISQSSAAALAALRVTLLHIIR